ncbi:MAG: hypothetical protein LC657_04300, partial [Desulfobacteraceae bacterium]|nr:hypothetical protein [Desulfobacteraceae bacterium]
SDFMRITGGDVLVFGDGHYLVLRDEVERSYGVEDPKYWVKRCRHLESGQRRLLKLVFYEKFKLQMGDIKITCYRSPRKEAFSRYGSAGGHKTMARAELSLHLIRKETGSVARKVLADWIMDRIEKTAGKKIE